MLQFQFSSFRKLDETVLGSFDIGHGIMRICKFFPEKMTIQMFQFWPFFIFESSQVTGIFHGAERFDFVPVAAFANSVAILPEHSHIKSDIVPDDAVRFFYIVHKIIDVAIDVIIWFKHGFADAVYSLCKEIHLGGDVDILIDSRFFAKFFSIPNSIYPSELDNLISRGESSGFCIDKEKSDLPTGQAGSFIFFQSSFLDRCFFRFCFRDHGIYGESKLQCRSDTQTMRYCKFKKTT